MPNICRAVRPAIIAAAALSLVASYAGLSASSSAGTQQPISTDTTAIVRSGNQLALDLLNRLGAGGNFVLSPYSIETALAMAHAGASTQTEAQIARVLHATGGPAALQSGLRALAAQLATATRPPRGTPPGDAAQLNVANGLWVQSGLALKPAFAQSLAQTFNAAPQLADFRSQPEAGRQAINKWVAAHTAQVIKELMSAGTIDTRTRLVLADALYLRAHWASPFNPTLTTKQTFTTATGQRAQVPFMTQAPTSLPYARSRGYQAVELPYLNSTLSMLVVMPTHGTFTRFAHGLTSAGALARIAGSLHPTPVDLRMPRFHLAAHQGLVPALAALGMPLAFSDAADFSGITARPSLKISQVEHAADLVVDEHGTVATAATGIAFVPTSAPARPTKLTLDHPFLLFVRDTHCGAILFAARVTDPSRT
jgi:serpin B